MNKTQKRPATTAGRPAQHRSSNRVTVVFYALAAVPVLVVLWLVWRSDEPGTAGDWFCAHRAEQVASGEWRYPEGC